MFINFQTTSEPMTLSKLSLWQTPEQVCDILLALPEKQRNRALYELVFLFDHENPQGRTEAESQLAALRLLWHDPRFQGLENIKHWLRDVLGLDESNGSWLALQGDIETLMEMLHPFTPPPRNLPHLRRIRRHVQKRANARTFCRPNVRARYRSLAQHGLGLSVLEQRAPLFTPRLG